MSTDTNAHDHHQEVKEQPQQPVNSLYERAKRKLKLETPASQAVTYSQLELPYHAPPVIYKIVYNEESRSATLFERVNTWKGSKEELRENEKALSRIRQDQLTYQQQQQKQHSNISSSSSTSSSSDKSSNNESNTIINITNNVGDFLAYHFLKGCYPDIEWTPVNSDSALADLFTKENSMLNKKANYMWAIDANFNFIFAPEHQMDFALQRIRVKHGDLTATGKTLIGSLDNLTVGRLPAR